MKLLTPAIKDLAHDHRRVLIAVVQVTLFAVSNVAAWLLRFDFALPDWAIAAVLKTLPIVLLVRALVFLPFRLYEGLWRYTSVYDLQALASGIVTSSGILFLLILGLFGLDAYPRSVFVIDTLVLILLLGATRMARRVYLEVATPNALRRRLLIYGAGDAGAMIARQLKQDVSAGYIPIAFVDDAVQKQGRLIHGLPVLAGGDQLPSVVERLKPAEILIAMPTADPAKVRLIVKSLEPFSVPIRTLPALKDVIGGTISVNQIRTLAVEDLLSRAPIGLDQQAVRALIEGRRIMVTGAGGSIGSELSRQILDLNPKVLVLLDRYENSLHNIQVELGDRGSRAEISAVVGDVADREVIGRTLARFRPEIVFHAAAHKHVPLMEGSPAEAIKNNVRGTRILAESCAAAGVEKFVLVSTDKAVNPRNVMGASKRLAELVVRLQAQRSSTAFVIVRFGNVLGSNGSVVPRFLEQIRLRKPVTVTHPEVRRFFMLIPEAVQLILHASSQAEGGATYMLDMGEQIKVVDMARNLIRLSGLVPEQDIPITFIGLRPGEKIEEELVGSDEQLLPSGVEKVFRLVSQALPGEDEKRLIDEVEALAAAGDTVALMRLIESRLYESTSAAVLHARV